MSLSSFQQEIESLTRKKLKLRINDNHATMLSVKWDPYCTTVSLHRMFLEAPKNVMEKLSCYIQRKDKIVAPEVKAYIETNLKKLDYSDKLKKLYTQGSVYNLKQMYDIINEEYFENKLNLHITWYGKKPTRRTNKVTFGLYHEPMRLIKIHKRLDCTSVPDYVISYVIYHEMLHYVCPPFVDEKGVHRMHNSAFKKREKEFKYYKLAQSWIKKQQPQLYGD